MMTLMQPRMALIGWYDPDKKRSVAEKLARAMESYERRSGFPALIAYLHPSDAVSLGEFPDLEIRPADWVPVNTFYVGIDDGRSVTNE